MSFFDLPAAGTGDLQIGAVLVLQDRRMVTILDVVRYTNIDHVIETFKTGRAVHSPLLGPIQFLAVLNEATGKRESVGARHLSGARLLRPAAHPRAA